MKVKYKYIFKPVLVAFIACLSLGSLSAESLYPLGSNLNPIANKVAATRGDILRVLIAETTSLVNSTTMSTNKESSINNQVNQFLFSTAASGFGTHNGELPATNITGENGYSGGGSITNTQSISDSFTVMVADVLPNGNMLVQGARKVQSDGQTGFLTLTGIVRYWDVTSTNTVNSNQIYDLKLEYVAEGTLRNATKKGWLGKLNEILNPF